MTAAVVNASQRGGTVITLLTDRTKRRKSTRSINHTSIAEAAETHIPLLLSDREEVVATDCFQQYVVENHLYWNEFTIQFKLNYPTCIS